MHCYCIKNTEEKRLGKDEKKVNALNPPPSQFQERDTQRKNGKEEREGPKGLRGIETEITGPS